jgi:transcriptional regulator with XRE-family HTH domain
MDMLTKENWGKIRELRLAKKLTPEEAAELAGISAIYWRHIELGLKINPSIDTLQKMAGALGCQVADFEIPAMAKAS